LREGAPCWYEADEGLKPPSEEWYQFADRIESETQADPGAGYTAEEFLPSFWQNESDTGATDRRHGSKFWPSILIGAIAGGLIAAEFWRRSRDEEEERENRKFGTSGTYDRRYRLRR
jgi:hypothetical protein